MVDSDDGRLGEHDAAAANVDQRVGGAQIDGDVARAEAWKKVEETDDGLLSVWCGRSCYTPEHACARNGTRPTAA